MGREGINPHLPVLCPAPNPLDAEGYYHLGKVSGNGSGQAPSLRLHRRNFISRFCSTGGTGGGGKGSYLTRETMTLSRGILKSSGNAKAPSPTPAPRFGRQPGKVCAPLGWYPHCCHGNERRDGAAAIILLCTSSSLPKATSPGIRNDTPPSPGITFPSQTAPLPLVRRGKCVTRRWGGHGKPGCAQGPDWTESFSFLLCAAELILDKFRLVWVLWGMVWVLWGTELLGAAVRG